MNREDIEKLLGGYATDTLTPEEREVLFAAALEDQDLFDQLAREEPLRQVLGDPGTRAELLAALDARPEPWYRRFAQWLGRPAGLASAAATAAALTLAVFVSYQATRPKPVTVAEVRAPSAVESTAPRPYTPPAAGEPKPAELPRPPLVGRRAVAPLAAPPAAPGIAGGVVGGIINAPRGSGGFGAAPPAPPPPPPQKGANEVAQVMSDAVVAQRAAPPKDARALFNAAPLESSVVPRQERAEEKVAAESASAAARSGADTARLRMAAPRAAKVAPAAALTPAPSPHLGLRYRVLRRDPDGAFSAVDPDTVFRTGDEVRLVFEPNDSGYLYLFERDAAGAWRQLASDRVERLASYQVPRTGAMRDEEPGVRQLYAVFSRRPDPALAGVEPATLDARLGGSLLKQKPGDHAVYVVNTSDVPQSQQVAVAITLTRR